MIMTGYLEMIAEGRLSFEEVVETAQLLLTDAKRMQRLLSDMRMLARIELSSLPLNLQVVQPQPLIAEVIRSLTIQERQEVCRLTLDCPESLPPIFADPDRTRQILVNLVANALNYTLEGSVTVWVSYDSKYLWGSITDTGIGMSEEDLPRVFDRFWRSERSRELRQEGSGIGLALTKRLVEAQSGRIEVESDLGRALHFEFANRWLSIDVRRKPKEAHELLLLVKQAQIHTANFLVNIRITYIRTLLVGFDTFTKDKIVGLNYQGRYFK